MRRDLVVYLLRRIGQFALIVFLAVTLNFAIPRLLPGDPVEIALSRLQVTSGSHRLDIVKLAEAYRARFGFDQPIWKQYLNYWQDLSRGELGVSFADFPEPVADKIKNALPWTLGLLVVATLIAFVFGSVIGAWLAWPRAPAGIRVLVPVSMILASIPPYLLAIVLVFLFAVVWKVFPPAGAFEATRILRFDGPSVIDLLRHAFLPALTIVLGSLGLWALGMRGLMVSILGEDFITFADAKGLPRRRVFVWYGMRNALLPQVTALALALGTVLSGAVLVEVIFSYPGLGLLLFRAIQGKDYFVVQGVVLTLILTLGFTLFVIDLLYPLIDPRIRRR
ncbi:MAG: ABC transporter permease [Solirubrobacterales bacterium]|nr:ABC transporter permease [Solirubrobacterales bacterium]